MISRWAFVCVSVCCMVAAVAEVEVAATTIAIAARPDSKVALAEDVQTSVPGVLQQLQGESDAFRRKVAGLITRRPTTAKKAKTTTAKKAKTTTAKKAKTTTAKAKATTKAPTTTTPRNVATTSSVLVTTLTANNVSCSLSTAPSWTPPGAGLMPRTMALTAIVYIGNRLVTRSESRLAIFLETDGSNTQSSRGFGNAQGTGSGTYFSISGAYQSGDTNRTWIAQIYDGTTACVFNIQKQATSVFQSKLGNSTNPYILYA